MWEKFSPKFLLKTISEPLQLPQHARFYLPTTPIQSEMERTVCCFRLIVGKSELNMRPMPRED